MAIAAINHDRMERCAVGWSFLIRSSPGLPPRMIVEALDFFPRHAPILRTKETLRRRAHIPHVWFARMPWAKPKIVMHHAPLLSFGRFGKGRRPFRLLPGFAQIS